MIRSLKTLGIRTLKHGLNALRIAEWLQNRPEVDVVRYPGLRTSEAFHQVEPLLSTNARRELEFLGWKFPFKQHARPVAESPTGSLEHVRSIGIPFGGVITFTLKDATEQETERFVTSLRLVALAESLGGVESLIEVPYGMTHAVGAACYQVLNITDDRVCQQRPRLRLASRRVLCDSRLVLRMSKTSSRTWNRDSRRSDDRCERGLRGQQEIGETDSILSYNIVVMINLDAPSVQS
jgi:hypothetical protein